MSKRDTKRYYQSVKKDERALIKAAKQSHKAMKKVVQDTKKVLKKLNTISNRHNKTCTKPSTSAKYTHKQLLKKHTRCDNLDYAFNNANPNFALSPEYIEDLVNQWGSNKQEKDLLRIKLRHAKYDSEYRNKFDNTKSVNLAQQVEEKLAAWGKDYVTFDELEF